MNETFTINVDASHDPESGRAAWAYLIVHNNVPKTASGVFKGKVPNISMAELLAFERALAYVNSVVKNKQKAELTIHSDNMYTVKILDGLADMNRMPFFARAILHHLKDYRYQVFHVRAHTFATDEPSRHNEWCDQAARKALRDEVPALPY